MTALVLSIIVFFVSYGVVTFGYNWVINTTSIGERMDSNGVTFRDWYASKPWVPTIDALIITGLFVLGYFLK